MCSPEAYLETKKNTDDGRLQDYFAKFQGIHNHKVAGLGTLLSLFIEQTFANPEPSLFFLHNEILGVLPSTPSMESFALWLASSPAVLQRGVLEGKLARPNSRLCRKDFAGFSPWHWLQEGNNFRAELDSSPHCQDYLSWTPQI